MSFRVATLNHTTGATPMCSPYFMLLSKRQKAVPDDGLAFVLRHIGFYQLRLPVAMTCGLPFASVMMRLEPGMSSPTRSSLMFSPVALLPSIFRMTSPRSICLELYAGPPITVFSIVVPCIMIPTWSFRKW